MDKLIEWLPQNIPDNDESSIVHGDYRLDNVIVHPTEPKIIGILDWELSTIGHPLGDFTYNLLLADARHWNRFRGLFDRILRNLEFHRRRNILIVTVKEEVASPRRQRVLLCL